MGGSGGRMRGMDNLQFLSRRSFLVSLLGAAWLSPFLRGSLGPGRSLFARGIQEEPEDPQRPERQHLPRVNVPRVAAVGSVVPIVVEVDHPMEPDHYIKRIEILNYNDPIPSKGTFYLTPANGHAYLSTQVRMSTGESSVVVLVECNRHGTWTASRPITVKGEGCAIGPEEEGGTFEIREPRLRLPRLIKTGEVIKVQVKFTHPCRTGLRKVDGRFIQEQSPLYIKTMEVFYGGERISLYEMTPALSDNPFISFMLKAAKEALLKIVFTNSEGEKFEVAEELRFSR